MKELLSFQLCISMSCLNKSNYFPFFYSSNDKDSSSIGLPITLIIYFTQPHSLI